jgi:small subunit ribosomal protein S9
MAEKKKKTTKKTPRQARGEATAKKKRTTKKTEKVQAAEEKAKVKAAAAEPIEAEAKAEAPAVEPPKKMKPVAARQKKEKLPKGHKYYGTGRRKEAVAKVWLKPGNGQFNVNSKTMAEYFCGRKLLEFQVTRALSITNTRDQYDVFVEAFGGGVPGQAGAISQGIARALLEVSPDFRIKLKREGLLRRDPRMKERKKYGRKRARRAFQYTKR